MNNAKTMARIAYDALEEKKGSDIQILDISKISVIADYFIIATGSNNTQIDALVDNVEEKLGRAGFPLKSREGNSRSPWVLLDYNDIIVHVFEKESRGFYNLEHLWHDGTKVLRKELDEDNQPSI